MHQRARQAWGCYFARRGAALPLLRERHVGWGPQGFELMQGHRVCALKDWVERLRGVPRAAAQPAIVFLAFAAEPRLAIAALWALVVGPFLAFVALGEFAAGPRRMVAAL